MLIFPVDLELLMDRVNDLLEMRIDAVLQEMSGSALCVLPEHEPITCEDFVRTTRVKIKALYLYLSYCLSHSLFNFFCLCESKGVGAFPQLPLSCHITRIFKCSLITGDLVSYVFSQPEIRI